MCEIVEKAKIFATKAHHGQLRRYTNKPYINHPQEVVNIVSKVAKDQNQIAAAWLHDVVEDTVFTLKDIEDEFGRNIAELVYWLTDVSKPQDGSRATRKAIDRQHIAKAPGHAQTIKLADIIDNLGSILKYDARFASVYINEKKLVLEVLTKGDGILYKTLAKMLDNFT